ncbi:hypothetical protein M3T53_04365 [Actinomyces sp. B33]|uniref:hypothetical protein n=1 Tax=Actinomyces sp. B33 TaxID=2942131 RepID=UPI002340D124|nr:hypothetical protein [Actinomyces sp. B33]MDC4232945.1 hypothetical protein [Actinomyces sp. B33]
MFAGVAVMVLTLLLTLGAAVGVLVGLALVRRPAQVWQSHLREQGRDFQSLPEPSAVGPTPVRLTDLMEESATGASAYFDPDRLPGISRIEHVTDRIEAFQASRGSRRP